MRIYDEGENSDNYDDQEYDQQEQARSLDECDQEKHAPVEREDHESYTSWSNK